MNEEVDTEEGKSGGKKGPNDQPQGTRIVGPLRRPEREDGLAKEDRDQAGKNPHAVLSFNLSCGQWTF